jgi:hypothetical protein
VQVYTSGLAQIAATSPPDRLPLTDGRTAESRYLKRICAEPVAQCGGAPSASERLLIDRAVMLSLRVLQMDQV